MDKAYYKVNFNPMKITSLSMFAQIESSRKENGREVYFIRLIGQEKATQYEEELPSLDRELWKRAADKGTSYIRLSQLKPTIEPDTAAYYMEGYESWKKEIPFIQEMPTKFQFQQEGQRRAMCQGFQNMVSLYQNSGKQMSESMIKNFVVKGMFWLDTYFPQLFISENSLLYSPKVIYCGEIKMQEYLFLYFLAWMGCDVLYLNPEKDITFSENLKELSLCERKRVFTPAIIPEYKIEESNYEKKNNLPDRTKQGMVKLERSKLVRPKKNKPESSAKMSKGKLDRQERAPLNYVDLAKMASSVVMISVFDKKHEVFKTGSGVILNEKGYVLTNFHVACEGMCYGIQLEEETHIYETDELIKYNPLYDLAILRMEQRRKAIPVYQGSQSLVRGEKVVAIGSPLGLFNSVSDGIIAGFRKLDQVSMIQFTAPTSHGSSGGALLNQYGELIGIITGGFDEGQNLNLAVDYQTIIQFAGNLLK